MSPRTRQLLLVCGQPFLTVAIAIALTIALIHLTNENRTLSLMFFGAIMLSTWYRGKTSGLIATAISLVSLGFFLREPFTDYGVIAKALSVIRRNAVMQSHLINNLLDVTAIAAKGLKLNLEVVDVSGLLESGSQRFYPSIVEKRINLQREIKDDIPAVYADRDRLVQVIDNLLANAIKFTPPEGHIRIGSPDLLFITADKAEDRIGHPNANKDQGYDGPTRWHELQNFC